MPDRGKLRHTPTENQHRLHHSDRKVATNQPDKITRAQPEGQSDLNFAAPRCLLPVGPGSVVQSVGLSGSLTYEYELREGDEVIATGRLTVDHPLAVSERVAIGARTGVVVELLPRIHGREERAILETSTSS
jgi:hypothetical protein